ncbi:MAG: histidinol dehydrogenase [Nitrososphaerota archaeon]|nr:histidinol dehydrogenase [Nitrososphaerota archaeon]MDW8041075.1 histidinol dehydrogenase [Nitrososphaerota archaeon]
MIRILDATDTASVKRELLQKRLKKRNGVLEAYVKEIIRKVQLEGDAALIELTERFDKVSLDAESLRVSRREISEAYAKVTKDQIRALKSVKERLEVVERKVLEKVSIKMEVDGVQIKFRICPLQRVGCYVPGGKAAYPTTLLMTVVPALVAGVSNIVVCSPPDRNGSLNPLTLVAADICRVNEIYRVGGPQAIAAMAYGTETIKPVDKIVGPGNIYVATAKMLVSRDTAIDFPAGPSELLVLADETANPRYIALDMCAQAEHGPDSIVGLVTTSKSLAQKTLLEIEEISKSTPRREFVTRALSENGFIAVCETLDAMVELANSFAPEHVELMLKNPEEAAERIFAAGIILVGAYSPASLSDYYGGTNHVLPTAGHGRFFSALSCLDFVKRVAVLKCSKKGLLKALEHVRTLSEAENLPGHFKAVEERLIV